ncbi:MAG: peptide chain release factor N(5)-glutamine methyltransferase [Rhizobacter sp.]|nr:peptide chain release factor N(5)-glutamine methyltransferase [Rhizobacter sp.]
MAATFAELLEALATRLNALPDKPEETPEATLRVLWHLAAGTRLSVQAAEDAALPALDDAAHTRLAQLTAERLSGVPLAHLSGRQRFMGLEMLAGKDALIPRRETELLGQAALERLREIASRVPQPMVLDVCTGSGNLALALAAHVPEARVFGADLSPEAVALARRNAEHLGLASRVEWRCGDLLAPYDAPAFLGQVDLLTCNPPYISSQKVDTMATEISSYEPRLAFDGGPLGVRILQRLIREAPRYLKPGGWLAFEVGHGQGPAVHKRLLASGAYGQTVPVHDAQGEIRALLASTS